MVQIDWETTPRPAHALTLTEDSGASAQFIAGWNGALARLLDAGPLVATEQPPRGMHHEYADGWNGLMGTYMAFGVFEKGALVFYTEVAGVPEPTLISTRGPEVVELPLDVTFERPNLFKRLLGRLGL